MRQLGLLGAALSAALVGSYLTWTSESVPLSGKSQVPIYAAKSIDRVVWKTDEIELTMQKKSDKHGDYIWIEVEEDIKTLKPISPKGNETDDDSPALTSKEDAKPVIQTVVEHKSYAFLANPKATELWEHFTPFYALRELNDSDPQSAAFGLDAVDTTLTLHQGDRSFLLELGGQSYGTRNQYLRYDQKVFLVESKLLRPLQNGRSRLVDKRTQPLQAAEVHRFDLTHLDEKINWTHINPDDRKMAFWARAQTPDEADELATGWIAKVMRLRADSVINTADLPEKKPLFSYTLTGKDSWSVHVFEELNAEPPRFFARSDYARGWVQLSTNQMVEIVEDLNDLDEAPAQ